MSSYNDGYANDPLEIKLVVCGDNFEIKDMRTPFSVIHDFGSVLCVYECVFLLILGMHKRNYIGISSRNMLNKACIRGMCTSGQTNWRFFKSRSEGCSSVSQRTHRKLLLQRFVCCSPSSIHLSLRNFIYTLM